MGPAEPVRPVYSAPRSATPGKRVALATRVSPLPGISQSVGNKISSETPECKVEIETLNNWSNLHIDFLINVEGGARIPAVEMVKWKPVERPFPVKPKSVSMSGEFQRWHTIRDLQDAEDATLKSSPCRGQMESCSIARLECNVFLQALAPGLEQVVFAKMVTPIYIPSYDSYYSAMLTPTEISDPIVLWSLRWESVLPITQPSTLGQKAPLLGTATLV
ncbi:hypothetical protein AAY473_023498 [Plecturocebus cupreus]